MKSRDEIIKRLDEIYSMDTLVRSKLTRRTVVDPNKSVNWNIQEVARINQQIDEERKEASAKQRSELRIAMADVFDYMRDRLDVDDPDPSPFVLKRIYDEAFEDGHAYGAYDVFNYIDKYTDLINDLHKLKIYGEAVRRDGEKAGRPPVNVRF